jgi:hypothetical protein
MTPSWAMRTALNGAVMMAAVMAVMVVMMTVRLYDKFLAVGSRVRVT